MPTRKSRTPAELTEGQAMYVLTRLVEDRRVSQTEVGQYVKEMDKEINTLEERLRRLRSAQSGGAKVGRRVRAAVDDASVSETTTARRGKRRRKRRQQLSPERVAKLKLQGHYLAMMRRLPERKRAQFKKMFREEGLEATVVALGAASRE
jgi:chromatin segregation and condensation protein Rec8/ScpA/Scc1 (kleisin family)